MSNEIKSAMTPAQAASLAKARVAFATAKGLTPDPKDVELMNSVTLKPGVPRKPGLSEDAVREIVRDELRYTSRPSPSASTSAAHVDLAPIKRDIDTRLTQMSADMTKGMQELERNLSDEVAAQIKVAQPTIVHVHVGTAPAVNLGSQIVHVKFAETLRKIAAGIPTLLVGPAGSGKTHLAAQIAEALGLPFTFNSMSAGVSESSLLGRTLPNASGEWTYKPAPFVVSYQNGGVHLLDEIDAADPNLLVQINAAIANGQLSIPFSDNSTPIRKHEKSYIIAAANTFGNGADRMYVGRNQLDAATVNRFAMGTVAVDYDRNLETKITQAILPDTETQTLLNWAWQIRSKIVAAKLRRIMSTRNIQDAAKLLKVGATLGDIRETYFAGWTADEKGQVNNY